MPQPEIHCIYDILDALMRRYRDETWFTTYLKMKLEQIEADHATQRELDTRFPP